MSDNKDPFVIITKEGNKIIRSENDDIIHIYKNIPMNLKFKHKMVNDHNQHLCGGWTVLKYEPFAETDRVAQGLKPVGISHSRDTEAVMKKALEYTLKGLLVSFNRTRKGPFKGMYDITVSVTGKLKDYFDMDTLAEDYERNGLRGDRIRKYKNVNFSEFHYGKFDSKYHSPEITGLILGYPIENTISLLCRQKYLFL